MFGGEGGWNGISIPHPLIMSREVPEIIWWWSKGIIEFPFRPNHGLRLEAGTKLNNSLLAGMPGGGDGEA